MTRPTRAVVDLESIRQNLDLARRLAPRSRVLAVIKADAYGHGAVPVARALAGRVDAFAVASIEEASELRDSGIGDAILLLEGPVGPDEVELAAARDYWLMVTEPEHMAFISRARASQPLTVWLKLDTGMHRLGLPPDAFRRVYDALRSLPAIRPDIVVATHLACADELDNPFTAAQITRLDELLVGLDAPVSIANSAALLSRPDSHRDWVRPGYLLFGDSPFESVRENARALQPAMSVSSAVIALRDVAVGETVGYGATWQAPRPSRIATIPMGYADGYPRHARNGTPVMVAGQRAPLAGRVSMDMITVDVTDLPDVRVGSPVELWGPQLPVGEVARSAGTIGYELLARLPSRLRREHRHGD